MRHALTSVVVTIVLAAAAGCGGSSPGKTTSKENFLSDAPTRGAVDAFTGQLSANVPGLLATSPASGVAIGVIRGGRLQWGKGFGVTARHGGAPVTASTRFQVASVTKSLTAFAAMRLVSRGTLKLDAPVGPQLARWAIPPSSFDASNVTLRRLLTHTAGFPLHGCTGPTEQPTIEDCLNGRGSVVDGAAKLELATAPGSGFQYTNGGFSVAQLLVEEATGKPFADVVRDEVLAPLGMRHSDVAWGTNTEPPLAASYDTVGGRVTLEPRAEEAAAGLATNVDDLSKFVALLSRGPGGPGTVLAAPALATMLTPQAGTIGNRGQGPDIAYGLGINLETLAGGVQLATHKGNNPGWTALIAALPGRGEGLVVMSNGDHTSDLVRGVFCRWAAWTARALPRRCTHDDVLGG